MFSDFLEDKKQILMGFIRNINLLGLYAFYLVLF